MLSEFSINIDYSKNIPCINIQGEIDIYTCGDLRETLQKVYDEKKATFFKFRKCTIYRFNWLGTIAHTAQKLEEFRKHYLCCMHKTSNKKNI